MNDVSWFPPAVVSEIVVLEVRTRRVKPFAEARIKLALTQIKSTMIEFNGFFFFLLSAHYRLY